MLKFLGLIQKIKWKLFFKSILKLIWRLIFGFDKANKVVYQNKLVFKDLELSNSFPLGANRDISSLEDPFISISVLDVYFSQLFSKEGVFLDLRRARFYERSGKLGFTPNSCYHTFSEDFRLGLLNIYEGLFLEKKQKLEDGLALTGLINNSSDANLVKKILFSHFKSANENPVEFEMKHLFSTGFKFLKYAIKNNLNLSHDLFFFGIYLYSLYSNLEKIQIKIDVKSAYLSAFERNNNLNL